MRVMSSLYLLPDVQLRGTPAVVHVFPSWDVAATARLWLFAASVDVTTSFTIQSFDVFGNTRTQGRESFNVRAEGGWTQALDHSVRAVTLDHGIVQDLGNGNYTATYYTTHSGSYSLHVSLDSGAISGSPFGTYLHPSSSTSIPNSEQIAVLPITVSAVMNELQVLAKDRYGNPRTNISSNDASRFTVTLRPSTKDVLNSTTSAGTNVGAASICDIWYLVTTSGLYTLHISYTLPVKTDPCISNATWKDSKERGCHAYTNRNLSNISAPVNNSSGVCGNEESNIVCCLCGGGMSMYYPAQSWHISGSPLPVRIVDASPNILTYVATFPTFTSCVPQFGDPKAICSKVPRITTA